MKIKKKQVEKLTEKNLKDLENYIRDFWGFLPISVCFISPLNIILNVTKRFEDFSGYRETEIIGEDLGKLFANKSFIEEVLEETREKKEISNKETIFLTKDKKEVPVSISTLQKKDETGDFCGYFLSIIDVSENKMFQEKLEGEVRKKTEELQKKVVELEKFQKLFVDRELKMVELKKEIERLKGDKEL